MGPNPHLHVLGLLLQFLAVLLAPGLIAFGVAISPLTSDQTCIATAQAEHALVDRMDVIGPTFSWNLAVQIVGPTASTIKGAVLYPLIVYRAIVWVVVLLIIIPLSISWYLRGHAEQRTELAKTSIPPKSHKAMAAWLALGWAASLPVLHCCLPWNLWSPISIPLLGLVIPLTLYHAGRNMPISIL